MSSAVLTLDLTTYDDNPLDQGDDLSAAGSQKYSETYSNSQINSPAVSAIGRAARKSSGLSSTSDERKLSGGSKPSSGSGSVDYQAKRKRGKASVRASVGRRQIHSDVAIETVSEGEEEED